MRIKKSQRPTAVPCSCQEEPEARRYLYLAPGYQTAGEATPSVRGSDPCGPVSAAPAAPQTARRQDILVMLMRLSGGPTAELETCYEILQKRHNLRKPSNTHVSFTYPMRDMTGLVSSPVCASPMLSVHCLAHPC